MNTRAPAFGYMSPVEGVLAMVSRGCNRLMKTGGGTLGKNTIERPTKYLVTPEEKQQMLSLLHEGKSMTTIATIMGRPYMTVARTTRPHRVKTAVGGNRK